MKKRPTQVDVARIAGVSRATVSFVVNGLTDGRVPISEETRQRVLAAIEELGYEPDASARALRSGDTKTIGLAIPDVCNPHFWDNVNGVDQEARAAGYRLLFSSMSLESEHVGDIYKDLMGQRIDGLMLMGTYLYEKDTSTRFLAQLRKHHLTIVEITDHPSKDPYVDCVMSDYRNATKEVMAYLLANGHCRIGLIYGVAFTELGVDRLEPYQRSLEAAGLPVDGDLIIRCGAKIEDGYQAALQLLRLPERPTAIVSINDLLAIGAARAIADMGLRIPADVSLVGYDDIFADNYLIPRLTTVSKDAVRMGREAVKLIVERLRDPSRPRQVIEIPARFIIRESTGPAPAKTPELSTDPFKTRRG